MPRIGLFSCLRSGLSGKVQLALVALGLALLGLQAWYAWPREYRPPRADTARATIDRQTLRERKDLLSQIPDAGQQQVVPPPPSAAVAQPPPAVNPNAIAGPIAIPAPISLSIPDASTPHPISIDGGSPLDIAFHPSRFVAQPPSAVAAEALRLEKARAFTMSMCFDLQGRLWIGSENNQPGDGTGGVQVYDPSKPPLEAWTQFTTKDGLGDDNGYAIACDLQGRIWVGHLNHGVSVYNAAKWQNYEVVGGLSRPDTLSGPLGERIFHITVCPPLSPQHSALSTFIDPLTNKESPLAGSVWMCTSAGLAIYFPATDSWSYLTRADGLPSDQANSLAFDQEGTAYLATQCDGIAIASPSDHYKTWKQVVAQPPSAAGGQSSLATGQLPTTPTGYGLPTNLMNDILVAKDGTIYAATTAGLAWSTDKGESWRFVRGADYADKVTGRIGGPPKDWTPQAGAILSEDYSIALVEDTGGDIHVGHRATAGDILLPHAVALASAGGTDFVSCLLTIPNTTASLRASYGTGLGFDGTRDSKLTLSSSSLSRSPPLPAGQSAHDAQELLIRGRHEAPTPTTTPMAFIGEDWATKGDWVGRYGRQYANLCAHNSPQDVTLTGGILQTKFRLKSSIGPHSRAGDGKRSWLTALRVDDVNSLYDPIVGNRREGEWDDHGETYDLNWDGPDLVVNATLDQGLYRLSLYFYDGNGYSHAAGKVGRDFLVEAGVTDGEIFSTLVHTRVHNFHGGHYKQFLLDGGHTYRFVVRRNGSLNTILNGIFLDRLAGPSGLFDDAPLGAMGRVRYDPPKTPSVEELPANARAVVMLWDDPVSSVMGMSVADMLLANRTLAYRAALGMAASESLLGSWRWTIPLWTPSDRVEWSEKMKLGLQSFLDANPALRQKLAEQAKDK